jgi:hypothetical protein
MLPVLSKIDAVFEYIRDEKGRPNGQTIDKLIDKLNVSSSSKNIKVTAKFDGTCCYIKDNKIFARQDVKKHISNAPEGWFPTAGTEPDKGGHIIGFRPLDIKKGDKWHFMALVDDDKARFIEYDKTSKTFYYVIKPITEFNGKTAELVGPHVNGNKHCLDKHAYIVHGSVEVDCKWQTHQDMKQWLETDGIIYEGVVLHDLENNKLYKCHRGHLGGSFIWNGCKLSIK